VFGQNEQLVRNMKRKQQTIRDSEATPIESPLTAQEERSLAEAAALGDSVARERLIMESMELARRVAQKWKGRGLEPEDLLSEATFGLIRAVDEFDPSRGMSFRMYASYCMRQTLARAVEETGSFIVLPAHAWRLIREWKRGTRLLAASIGRTPTQEEIAESLGFTPRQTRTVTTALTVGVKLASTVIGEGCDLALLEAGSNDQNPWRALADPAEWKILQERLDRLKHLERLVLTLRYGLDGNRPHGFQSIAAIVRLSLFKVKQIQSVAERKLRTGRNPRSWR
jgi:RNA polymerase primary sigma factor